MIDTKALDAAVRRFPQLLKFARAIAGMEMDEVGWELSMRYEIKLNRTMNYMRSIAYEYHQILTKGDA